MSIGDLTLKQLSNFSSLNPQYARIADRMLVSSYEDFVEILNQDIEDSIRIMEENPRVKQNENEDSLTDRIISNLKMIGYIASHDDFIGGHVDISVTHKNGYKWLGEAKIHDAYKWLQQGYQQLTTRYLRGTSTCCKGGMIIYVFNSNSKKVIETWKEKLIEESPPGFSIKPCPLDPNLAFYTTHTHASGLELSIRHKAVQLHFKPED